MNIETHWCRLSIYITGSRYLKTIAFYLVRVNIVLNHYNNGNDNNYYFTRDWKERAGFFQSWSWVKPNNLDPKLNPTMKTFHHLSKCLKWKMRKLLRKLVVIQNLVGEGRCPFTPTPELLIPPSLMAFTWNYRYYQQFLRK